MAVLYLLVSRFSDFYFGKHVGSSKEIGVEKVTNNDLVFGKLSASTNSEEVSNNVSRARFRCFFSKIEIRLGAKHYQQCVEPSLDR